MRKFGFTALVSFLFLLASCMNMGGSSGEDGAIRVALPGSGSRGAYTLSKEKAKTYKVALLLDGENLKTQTSEAGGGADIVFDELEPATYTVQVEAYDTTDVLLARKSETIKVTAGNTAECSIALALLGNRVLDTGYLLWKYISNESAYYFGRSESVEDFISNGGNGYIYGEPFGAAEDLESNWYYISKSNGDTDGVLYKNNSSPGLTINGINNNFFTDPLYYDEMEDALWFANSTSNKLNLSKMTKPSTFSGSLDMKEAGGIDFENKIGVAFAVQGNDIYIVYTDLINHYLQRGTISGNEDGTFTFEPVGSAMSAEDMGVSGAITDVAILYDGTVYVLVSNVGNSLGDSGDSFIYNYNQSNTMYSRGALLKIQSTSSGFEVVDTLGWTGSSRQIKPVGDAIYGGESLKPLTAYIPSLSENSKKFYGPRRFVAIKPKEIAIADCGANFVMPNCNERQNGKRFDHNRVVTVSLSSFAILGATELKNIKFSNLTLDGSGISGGYINAIGCEDKNNDKIEEQ